MKKLTRNYHTHTTLCGHAKLEDNENYVIEAINNNFKILGFSDHAPFPKIHHTIMRMDFKTFPSYIDMIQGFKEKYKDKIKILIGLEIEYYEDRNNYYLSLLKDYKLDYLILGQHCYYEKDICFHYYHDHNDYEGINRYVDDLIKGMKTGFFSYICHPDLFMQNVTLWNEKTIEVSKRIISAANELNLPLEININGFINGVIYNNSYFKYPDKNFFKLAKEMGSKFVFGIDAHDSKRLNQENIPYDKLDEFLKECNITDEDILYDFEPVNRFRSN